MSLAKVFSCAVVGLDGELIEVEVDIGGGIRALAFGGDRDRIDDRRMAVFGEGSDHLHARVSRGVRLVDDAVGRFAAGDEEEGGANAFGAGPQPSAAGTAGGASPATAACPSCGKQNAVGAKFCADCGAKMEVAQFPCVKCGAKLREGAKFCSECGSSQEKAKCTNCQAELSSGAKFCPECGTKTEAAQ